MPNILHAHIPGARFLDIDEISDKSNPAPHMLPSAAEFGAAMERLGVGRDDRIVVYDNSPIRTAARGWFTLRHFGADKVAILDGGFQKWLAEGRPTESGEPAPRAPGSTQRNGPAKWSPSRQIARRGHGSPLLDARGKARFEGTEPDPRPGVEPGHIPGRAQPAVRRALPRGRDVPVRARNRRLFAEAGIDPRAAVHRTCGSGVTATSDLRGASARQRRAELYDGSWSEWGADPATPKALGPA